MVTHKHRSEVCGSRGEPKPQVRRTSTKYVTPCTTQILQWPAACTTPGECKYARRGMCASAGLGGLRATSRYPLPAAAQLPRSAASVGGYRVQVHSIGWRVRPDGKSTRSCRRPLAEGRCAQMGCRTPSLIFFECDATAFAASASPAATFEARAEAAVELKVV